MCTSCLCFHLPSPWTEHMHTHRQKVLMCKNFKSCDGRNVGELLNACLWCSIISICYNQIQRRECSQEMWNPSDVYHRPFLLYISLLFAVSVTLSAAVTGHNRTVFCFLDKILFSASTPTRNHRETWSVMSDTPFVFVPLSPLKDSELTPHQPITPEYNRKNRGMLPVRKKGGESKASPHWWNGGKGVE